MTDGNIGAIAARVGLKNREAIYKWFVENPCKTRRECATAMDISLTTVVRHAQAIREGWRPQDVAGRIEADANGR